MRRLPALLLIAASGCAQLFGIDETSGPNVDPLRVSLNMQRWSVGASVSKNPLDMSMQSAEFLVDDGAGSFTRLPGELTAADTVSAELATGTPPVLFSLPDVGPPYKRILATPNRDHRAVFGVFEHPNPVPPLPSSQIKLTAILPTPYVSSESFRLEAIGAWMARGLVAAELPPPDMGMATINAPMMAYSTFARMTGSPAARITSQDVVVLLRYAGNPLTGVYQAPPFDQTDAVDTITANLVAVPANKPLSAALTPATYIQRFSAVRPSVTGLSQSWIVTAAPGWSIGYNSGPRLHAGTSAMADAMISTNFGNPFESLDWRSVFQFIATASRTYMFMGTLAVGLTAQMYTVTEPTGTITLDMPAGLPINIRANQVPLSLDGMTVMLDLTKAVEIDAITDRQSATVYHVALVEVAPSADGMTAEKRLLLDLTTTGEPKFRIPPDFFQVGHFYYFDFRSVQGGYTNAAMGDFVTYKLPYSVSRADSAVFQVVAP
jgi:hypothetical protein